MGFFYLFSALKRCNHHLQTFTTRHSCFTVCTHVRTRPLQKSSINHFGPFYCFFDVLHLSSHFGLFGRFPTRRFKLGLAFLILGRKNFCPKVQTCRNAQNAAFGKITRDNFHLELSLGMTLHFFYFMVNSMISKAGRSSSYRLS